MDDLQDLLAELDSRIQRLEQLDRETRDEVLTILQLVDRVHRPGLARLAEKLAAAGLWDAALEEEELHTLFMLYDLVTLDDEELRAIALDAVEGHVDGGEAEILKIEDGEVHLRLGSASGSSASTPEALRHGLEAALQECLPGFRKLVVH